MNTARTRHFIRSINSNPMKSKGFRIRASLDEWCYARLEADWENTSAIYIYIRKFEVADPDQIRWERWLKDRIKWGYCAKKFEMNISTVKNPGKILSHLLLLRSRKLLAGTILFIFRIMEISYKVFDSSIND